LRLRRAIHANDPLLVARILKSHPNLLHNPDTTTPNSLSNSNLHLAASLGHLEICKVLVAAGHEEPCPALNEHHQTALMLAAAAGHTDVVQFLGQRDPNSILRLDWRGQDAIMMACQGGHDTVLQMLLTWVPGGPQAAVQHADADGNTALHFASMNGHLLVLRTLLAAGADPDRQNAFCWTAGAYSATVQAEVLHKGLLAELRRRDELQRQAIVEKHKETLKANGGLRMVEDDGEGKE